MSGAQIGGAVGFVVGLYFGQPQIGYAIGSAIGGAVDPTKVYGPRLTDASTQTSKDGVICPWGYGTFPCMGNVIWQGELTERQSSDDGKGSGTEQITYTYHRSYAIRVCEGPITGFLQIKRNGKIVYDARTEADLVAELEEGGFTVGEALIYRMTVKAENAKFINNATLYLGDEDQLPDPTIEAVVGVGNVSPFRGRAYIVVEDDDLTETGGAIPQYEFVVTVDGTAESSQGSGLAAGIVSRFANSAWPLVDADSDYEYITTTPGEDGSFSTRTFTTLQEALDSHGYAYPAHGSPSHYVGYIANGSAVLEGFAASNDITSDYDTTLLYSWVVPGKYDATINLDVSTSGVCNTYQFDAGWTADAAGNVFRSEVDNFAQETDYSGFVLCETPDPDRLLYGFIPARITVRRKRIAPKPSDVGAVAIPDASGYYILPDGSLVFGGVYNEVFGTYRVLATAYGTAGGAYDQFELGPAIASTDPDYSNEAFWTAAYDAAVAAGDMPAGYSYLSQYPVAVASVYQTTTLEVGTVDPDSVVLGSIVADLFKRVGLTPDEYDVSQLTDLVPGFRVASESGADGMIAPLMQAYYFDVAEWDGKVRCVKRGGTPVMSLTMDDLVERDGDAIEKTRVQEAELLRRATVGYLDPAAGYTVTTQKWERRTSTVQAKGEQGFEVPVAMAGDTAAGVAKKKVHIGWAETERFKLSLPYRLTALTPGDIFLLTDADGTEYRIRLMQSDEDSGVLLLEGDLDGGTIYSATATGVRPPPRTITEPSVIGPTTLHVLDLPVWDKDANDELGVWIAVRGSLGGWGGAAVQISTDGGATFTTAATVTVPSTIGYTTSALAAWRSAEYPSEQSVTVYLPDAPASVTYEALLANRNRAALRNDAGAWEVLQYTPGTASGDNSYTLSGLVRGRYGTTAGAAASGAAFVLLNEAVQFVRVDRSYLNTPVIIRAVSLGTLPENSANSTLVITGKSQTEWPPHMVTATRDSGTNDVTVTWIGRGRLGSDTGAYHSKYMSGYRVTYSDGQTYDVASTVTTHTRASAPTGMTITVSALNSITGAGPASEAVSV